MRANTKTSGFTLVEILIVVIILAVIAAIVIPQFSNASATAKASMLADDLRILRTQIMVFRAQHNGSAPGYPGCDPNQTPTVDQFVAHMTMSSNAAGQTAAPGAAGYPYGPYVREIPPNPVNGKNSVRLLAADATFTPDDSSGWAYQPAALTVRADCTGADDVGCSYGDY